MHFDPALSLIGQTRQTSKHASIHNIHTIHTDTENSGIVRIELLCGLKVSNRPEGQATAPLAHKLGQYTQVFSQLCKVISSQ